MTSQAITKITRQEVESRLPVYRGVGIPPDIFLPNAKHIVILNQGAEGTTVGFGLAAAINYLRHERGERDLVSPRMLFEMAKRYAGLPDDRGAYLWSGVRGLLERGVCLEEQWPYVVGDPGFFSEAARKAALEIVPEKVERIEDPKDIRSAVADAHVVVVAFTLHEGWWRPEDGVVREMGLVRGGHTGAVLGYTETGFLFQNSWSDDWGGVEIGAQTFPGCAIWTYEDCNKSFLEGYVLRFSGEIIPAREPLRRAGYRPDAVEGRDKLDLSYEVESLAMVIASRDVEPPLAVGLFGDWGVGKSFFMKELRNRLTDISDAAREIEEHRGEESYTTEPFFWSDICQIDFNAWHFVDQSLWASIVVQIFDGLARHIADESDSIHAQRASLLDTIEARNEEVAQLTELRESVEADIQECLASIEKLDEQAQQERRELDLLDAQRVIVKTWNTMMADPALRNAVWELGIPETIESADELADGAREIRSTVGRLKTYIGVLLGQGRPLLRLGLLALIVFLGIGIGWIVQWLLADETYQEAAGAIARWFAWVGGVAASVGPLLEKTNDYLNQVESAFETVEKTANDPALPQLRQEHQAELDDLLAARADIEADTGRKRAEVASLQRAIDDLRVGRRLFDYIQHKAEASEYRDKLGIVSSVRRDFETLSDLLVENSQEKRKRWVAIEEPGTEEILDTEDSDPDQERTESNGKPEASGKGSEDTTDFDAEANVGNARDHRIASVDRIVLYIDDLDRCPPDRVVEVLQAVHLLLAFKLFAVVVAVDPRWLLRSLERQFPDFLALDRRVLGRGEISRWASTPQSYLEKIFQIAFTIRPMSEIGYRQLVDDLVRTAVEVVGDHQKGDGSGTSDSDSDTDAYRGTELPGLATSEDSALTPKRSVDPNPPSLEITDKEIEIMYRLHAVLGTPRSLKRFINTYRLIRASLSPIELRDFERPDSKDPSAVLLLLGVLAGTPQEAPWILHKLDQGSDEDSWAEFANGLQPKPVSGTPSTHTTLGNPPYENAVRPRIEESAVPRWNRVHLVMKEAGKQEFETLGPTRKWVRRVARCAFYPFRFESIDNTGARGGQP